GTHTECIGHVSKEYIKTTDIEIPTHFSARLITVNSTNYISAQDLAFLKSESKTTGLIIRTTPNTIEKTEKNYTGVSSVFIHPDAMKIITEIGIDHLIVDLPSVDHESDPNLQSHKIFWELSSGKISSKTITELVYIPNNVKDGLYLVNLMLPNMHCDAVPSKPILYSLR
ncbi:MAG: cyclase family protein, partial [Bacteroidia bacterium]